jgi:uncharacterized protein
MRRSFSGLLGALLAAASCTWGCACNRTEEPAAPSVDDTTAASGATRHERSAPAPSAPLVTAPSSGPLGQPGTAAAPPTACIVPLGEPAPIATPAAQCPKDPTGNLKLPLGKVVFVDAPAAPAATVELARDEAARERGLMYRTRMPENQGMLFSWQDERVRNFWMRNTCLPLDMLYITKDGIIAGILEQVPTLNDAPRGIRCPVAHVLELNAGWARAHGIRPGMKVAIEG